MLLDMRENPSMDRLEMPSDLTNTERKFLHTLAMQLGLKSKSTGKGDDRRIVVSRLSDSKKLAGMNPNGGEGDCGMDDGSLPVLSIGAKGIQALEQYIQSFPPNKVELAESKETGSSLFNKEAGGDDSELLDTLRELNIESSSKGHSYKRPKKHVNLQRRADLHHAAQDAKTHKSNYQEMQKMRAKLPAYSYQSEICNTIKSNRVTILSGDTGESSLSILYI